MSSGGGSSGTQTTTQELPAWAQPYAEQILQQGSALSQQQLPQYTGQTVAGLTDSQNQALQMIQQQATQGSSAVNSANSAVTGMLNNGGNPYTGTTANPYASQTTAVGTNPYIGQNPYLAQQVATAQGQTADAYNTGTASQTMAQFRNAGAFGGSAQQQYTNQQNQQLGTQLGNIATNMYGQDYANTQQLAQQNIALQNSSAQQDAARNAQYTQGTNQLNSQNAQYANQNQLAAAGLAPSLAQGQYTGAQALLNAGQLQQTQNQNDLNAQYQSWYNSAMSPYQQLGVLQSALSGALGAGAQGVTTSTGTQGSSSTLGGLLGGATTGAGLGSIFGPVGTAVGGIGGGLMGLFG
jgi:hypothetical protein